MSGKSAFFYLPSKHVSDGAGGENASKLPELSIVVPNESHPAYINMIKELDKTYKGPRGKKHYGSQPLKEGEWTSGEDWWNYGYSIEKIPTTVYTESNAGGKRKTRRNKGRK